MKKSALSISVLACLLLVGSWTPTGRSREPSQEQNDSNESEQGPVYEESMIQQIIADIEHGWEQADAAPFERHYYDFPGARYVESGAQNRGLRDLIDHHVVPEGKALSSLNLEVSGVEVHFEDGFAWAIGGVEVRATVASSGEEIHRRGFETFLFRWIGGAWKVVHTHSSTRPVRR